MAGAVCSKLIRGKVLRVTKLDSCGAKLPGPLNKVVTKGFVSVVYTPTNYAGTPIQLPNANGDLEIDEVPVPKFSYFTDVISLIGVNPLLIPLLSGQETWEGIQDGEVTGFTIGDDVDPEAFGFALEGWSGVYGNLCDDGVRRYGYFLQPRLLSGSVDAITLANDAVNFTPPTAAFKFTIPGARTSGPHDWGVGPWNVTLDEDGDPAPLRQALPVGKHMLIDQVTLAPPVDECGASAVGVKATGATAGIPGTFTPADGSHWVPVDLADLTGVTASPNTAWTTGQKVVLGDGTLAHWSGSAWVAGAA